MVIRYRLFQVCVSMFGISLSSLGQHLAGFKSSAAELDKHKYVCTLATIEVPVTHDSELFGVNVISCDVFPLDLASKCILAFCMLVLGTILFIAL